MAKRRLSGLTLNEFSDEEFLAKVMDTNGDGWISTDEISDAINLDVQYPNSNVGIRLSWLKRFGVVERDFDTGMWRVTKIGQDLVTAKFSSPAAKAIDAIDDSQLFLLSQRLSSRYERVNPATANLVRRQFARSTFRRRERRTTSDW
jgi:hypothetical protein